MVPKNKFEFCSIGNFSVTKILLRIKTFAITKLAKHYCPLEKHGWQSVFPVLKKYIFQEKKNIFY